jgi:hypothetical protein
VEEDIPVNICYFQIDEQGNGIPGTDFSFWEPGDHSVLYDANVLPNLTRGFTYRFYAHQVNSLPTNVQDYVGAHYGYIDRKILKASDANVTINIRTDQIWQ